MALSYWTVHFLFDEDIKGIVTGMRGVDYYRKLLEFLGRQEATKTVCGTLH